MRCHGCGNRSPANVLVQVSPGGQCAPGTFLLVGLGGLGATALGGLVVHWMPLAALGIVTMLFAWVQVPIAMLDCQGSCLACGTRRRIRPWSL